MKFSICLSLFLFTSVLVNAQVFIRADTTLSLFTVNDSTKYFEVTTPSMSYESVMCGILITKGDSLYKLKYADGYKPCMFNVSVSNIEAQVEVLENQECYTSTAFGNLFDRLSKKPVSKISSFRQRWQVLYKARRTHLIKLFEYPSFNAKTSNRTVQFGFKIKIKKTVGVYKNYDPEKNNSWSFCLDENDKPLGWLLVLDKERYFQWVKPK